MSNIQLPGDQARATRKNRYADVYGEDFISLEDAELIVLLTGQHRGTVVEFSSDNETWDETWVPPMIDGKPAHHPEYARSVVTRELPGGAVVVRRTSIRWVEFAPDEDAQNWGMWFQKPTVMLGKCVIVAGYRSAFRDVIGNRYEPAELHQTAKAEAPKPHPPKVHA